jgi:creatinine amidohydrolase
MSPADSAERGRALLRERIAQADGFVARVPDLLEPLLFEPRRLPRMLVTTGIGTSEGHARHLAEAAARWGRQPARFATTGSLSRGVPRGSEDDWLVVFSQGLSANARFALRDPDRWGGVVLVTGLPRPGDAGFEALDPERRSWLLGLHARGGVQIEMGCGPERGTLLRVIGARVGYAIGWSLLRTLAARRLEPIPELDEQTTVALGAESEAEARRQAQRAFPLDRPLASFFEASRPLLIVAEGGALEQASQLSLKITEGMLRPQPPCIDWLHFAHGPLQSLAGRPASILYLAIERVDASGTEGLDDRAADRLERLRSALDPELHDLRVLRAKRPLPFAVLEFEAILDQLVLRGLEESGLDLVAWPGAEREASLYDMAPELSSLGPIPERRSEAVARRFETAVWPEIESLVSAGRRTALIGLGSIEQHGPHLPLGTDRWIAESLVRGLAARLPDALALPAIAIGCASEHLAFPGTLHIEPSTLEALLADLLGSVAAHGFERAFLFTAHGGNVDALERMAGRLVRRARPVELVIETNLVAVATMQAEAVRAEGLSPEFAGPHAGEYETSLVAALRPGVIRRAALAPGRLVSEGAEADPSLFYPSLRDRVESGVLGDPTHASAERGRRYLEAWLELLERAYHDAFSGRAQKKRA